MKVEFTDSEGGRFTLTLDGAVSKNKMVKIIEVFELLDDEGDVGVEAPSAETQFQKLIRIVEQRFPLGRFTSPQALEAYEDFYQSPIRLSTVSTYLNRLVDRRILRRDRSQNGYAYRKVSPVTQLN